MIYKLTTYLAGTSLAIFAAAVMLEAFVYTV